MAWIDDLPLFNAPAEDVARPFAAGSETSREGAMQAQPRAGSQAQRLLDLYKAYGPLTDHQASERLQLPLATICARRNWLIRLDYVTEHGTAPGPYKTKNIRWGVK